MANQVVQGAGGIGAVGPGDLIALPGLRLVEAGNVTSAIDVRNNIVGTRLAAADFNLNYAGYPMAQAVNYREVLEGSTSTCAMPARGRPPKTTARTARHGREATSRPSAVPLDEFNSGDLFGSG